MAYSYQLFTGNGSTATFTFSSIDGYLSPSHLRVYVDDVLKTASTHYNINEAANTVTFTSGNIPGAGSTIKVQRVTPKGTADREVNFEDGSILTAADLDDANLQLLYIAQESSDDTALAMGPTYTGADWDAGNKRLTNVANPVASQDAVTKVYVDQLALYGGVSSNPQSWTLTAVNGQTSYTLSSPTPLNLNKEFFIVQVGGIMQPTANYDLILSGSVYSLVFPSAVANAIDVPGTGTVKIIVRNFGTTRVANTGSVSTDSITDGAVTEAKLGDLAVTEGKIAAQAVTQAKIGPLAVTTGKIAAAAVDFTKLVQAATGLSIVGRATSGAGAFSEIAATDNTVLRRSGSSLGFGSVPAGAFTSNTLPLSAVANQTGPIVLGREAATSGAVAALNMATLASMLSLGADGNFNVFSNRNLLDSNDASGSRWLLNSVSGASGNLALSSSSTYSVQYVYSCPISRLAVGKVTRVEYAANVSRSVTTFPTHYFRLAISGTGTEQFIVLDHNLDSGSYIGVQSWFGTTATYADKFQALTATAVGTPIIDYGANPSGTRYAYILRIS